MNKSACPRLLDQTSTSAETRDTPSPIAHQVVGTRELADAVAESERRWGEEELGLSIVTSLLPALEENSDTYAPNCVCVAFLDHDSWDEPWTQPFIDRWPAPIRDDLRRRQALRRSRTW